MGLIRRLDDLDTRVIGRGNPNWRWPTPTPWTPGMRPLIPARGSYVPEACFSGVSTVVLFVFMLSSPPDYTVAGVLWAGLLVAIFALLGYRTRFSHPLADAAAVVSSDVPVDRSRWVPWATAALPNLFVLAVVVLIVVDGNARSIWFLPALLLGGTVGIVGAESRFARWEHEHGVELLRSRKWRHKGLYVRPRTDGD